MKTKIPNILSALTILFALFNPSPSEASDALEIAQARAPQLNLVIDARCEGGAAVFRMQNRGDMWPKTGALMVMTHDGEKVLYKRDMRFAIHQTATIRFMKAAKYPAGVTLYVRPRWQDRGYGSGIKLRCR